MWGKFTAVALAAAIMAVLMAGVSNSASAQATAQATPAIEPGAQTDSASAELLSEVVVTAERRAVDIQNTPTAIIAETGAELSELHLDTISSLQTTVPAFTSDDSSGLFSAINIRGMGNSAINPAITVGVAVFRDGVLMGETIGQNEALFDIHDVSVLEGPQGTFVGASSTAGAVLITTNDPEIGGGVHGYLTGQLGNYTDHELQGAVNLPINDTLAARIAFDYIHRNSFSHDFGSTFAPGDTEPSTDPGHLYEQDARLSLLWRPSSNYQALAKLEYSYSDTGDSDALPNPHAYNTLFGAGPQANGVEAGCTLGGPLNVNQLVCPEGGSLQHSQFYYPGEKPYDLYYAPENANAALNSYAIHLSLKQDFTLPDGIDLRSLSGFSRMNYVWSPNISYSPANAGWEYHLFPDDDYYTQEFDLISPTTGDFYSKVNWLLGAFYYYRYTPVYINNLSVSAPYTVGTLPSSDLIVSNLATARTEAVFGQLNFQLTDTLQLQIGARENWDNNFATQDPQGSTAAPFSPALGPSGAGVYLLNYCGQPGFPSVPSFCAAHGLAAGTPAYLLLIPINSRGQYADSTPTGKIDLSYTPIPGQNFYAFYARGYKSGGANAGSTDHPTWAPEYVNDYEVGWKGRLFDGHMLTQVGAYYYNYQNMQYQVFDSEATNDTSTGSVVVNLAPTTIWGFEIAEQARFGGLGVNLGFSYNKSSLGNVDTLNSSALPGPFNSPINHPQCLPGHAYSSAAPCFDYTPYLTNTSGEQNPFAPKITANISVDYAFPIGIGDQKLDPRVTFSHTDKQYDSIFENAYNEMQSRNLWNASIDWIAGQWVTQVYGTNLTNQVYIIGENGTVNYGAPRQYGLRVTRQF
jgi:iron complex outermembrane receptor protein